MDSLSVDCMHPAADRSIIIDLRAVGCHKYHHLVFSFPSRDVIVFSVRDVLLFV